MSQQHWLQISVHVAQQNLETTESIFLESGALSITLTDAENQPLLEPLPGETPLWHECILTALYADPNQQTAILLFLQQHLAKAISSSLRLELLEDKDWIRAWMENYQPMCFGHQNDVAKQLWVYPSHIESDHRKATTIILDPGLAFGTGTHATTALCLDWIAQHDLRDKTVIDYGCGSGILGIAAIKRGAQSCYANDIDALAISAAEVNARTNKVNSHFTASITPPVAAAEVVFANILANTLIELFASIDSLCKANADLLLSGILVEQLHQVIAAYRTTFDIHATTNRDGWACIHAIKKAA